MYVRWEIYTRSSRCLVDISEEQGMIQKFSIYTLECDGYHISELWNYENRAKTNVTEDWEVEESPEPIGSTRGTSPEELMTDRVKNFSNDIHGPENTVSQASNKMERSIG